VLGSHIFNTQNNGPGINLNTAGSGNGSVSSVRLTNVVCADLQTTKTQSYGLQVTENSSGSVTGLQILQCDFSQNSTGDVTGLNAWTPSTRTLLSYATHTINGGLYLGSGAAVAPTISFVS